MNSSIGIRQAQDGGANASVAPISPSPTEAPVEYDEMDAVIHNDDEAAADFLERLGDLDQFVGATSETVTVLGAATRNVAPLRSGFNSNGDFVVVDQAETAADVVTGFEQGAGEAFDAVDTDTDSDEAADFLERLGDLDRFIATVPDDEVADFHQRLSDLDRFVSAADTSSAPSSLCTACRKPLASNDVSTVHAVHLLGSIEGRQIEGLPRLFHATCWVDGDGQYRRTR